MANNLSITDLFTPVTSADIRTKMVAELIVLGVPADKWRAGGVASTMLTVTAIVFAMFSSIIANVIQGFFLPTATGLGLKLLAKYLYGVIVPDASFATGLVTLTNSGGSIYNQAAGTVTLLNTVTNTNYTNVDAFTLGALASASVRFRATAAGTAGNASPGTITVVVTSLLGVTCTNAAALTGVDVPDDATIRALCLAKLGVLGVRGVRTAYQYAIMTALNVTTLSPVNINRSAISSPSHTGDVNVVIAAPSGTVDPDDLTGVANNIEALARPEGVTVNLSAATAVPYTQAITLYCKAPTGVDAPTIKNAAAAALVTFFAGYRIGGETFPDDADPTVTGLIGVGVYGALAAAVASTGATMVSATGAVNMALTTTQVAEDDVVLTVRVEAMS